MIGRTRYRHYVDVKGTTLSLEGPVHGAPGADTKGEVRLAAIADAHFEFIWRLLRRWGLSEVDADDAAQQVFMIATQKIDQIAKGSERTFLYGTALRVAANARRKARREPSRAETAPGESSDAGSPDSQVELQRARALLDELLQLMPAALRRVLVLAEIEQLPVPEIARLESIPLGTAASRLRRARASFRELLRSVRSRNPFGGTDE